MSLEQGCRRRLEQTEDGRQALAVLDEWEKRVTLLELVRGICELRTRAYLGNPLGLNTFDRDPIVAAAKLAVAAWYGGDAAADCMQKVADGLTDSHAPEVVRPWRELGFVEICATLGVEWLPNEWKKLEPPQTSG